MFLYSSAKNKKSLNIAVSVEQIRLE